MKCALILCFLGVVAMSTAVTQVYPRGCRYIMGKCKEECPVGTHSYALGCGYKVPEPTCQVPVPVAETYILCDYSSCYCDPPTVRNPATNECVPLSDCPQ